jgi:hypothetical protein
LIAFGEEFLNHGKLIGQLIFRIINVGYASLSQQGQKIYPANI